MPFFMRAKHMLALSTCTSLRSQTSELFLPKQY